MERREGCGLGAVKGYVARSADTRRRLPHGMHGMRHDAVRAQVERGRVGRGWWVDAASEGCDDTDDDKDVDGRIESLNELAAVQRNAPPPIDIPLTERSKTSTLLETTPRANDQRRGFGQCPSLPRKGFRSSYRHKMAPLSPLRLRNTQRVATRYGNAFPLISPPLP